MTAPAVTFRLHPDIHALAALTEGPRVSPGSRGLTNGVVLVEIKRAATATQVRDMAAWLLAEAGKMEGRDA
jgi:hypothetical protein